MSPSLGGRSAQTNAVCAADYAWADNSHNMSPCYVASALNGACVSNDWLVPALPANSHYDNPNVTTANLCSCSWAVYNLLGACTACQGFESSIQNWAVYDQHCGPFGTGQYFPSNVTLPADTAIPFWATADPSTWANGQFSPAQAQQLAQQSHQDIVPGSTPPKKSKPVGAIAGGVVGGIVALLAIAGLLWFWRKKRRQGIYSVTTSSARPPHVRHVSDMSTKSLTSESVTMISSPSASRGTIPGIRSLFGLGLRHSSDPERVSAATIPTVGYNSSPASPGVESTIEPFTESPGPARPRRKGSYGEGFSDVNESINIGPSQRFEDAFPRDASPARANSGRTVVSESSPPAYSPEPPDSSPSPPPTRPLPAASRQRSNDYRLAQHVRGARSQDSLDSLGSGLHHMNSTIGGLDRITEAPSTFTGTGYENRDTMHFPNEDDNTSSIDPRNIA